MDNIITTMLTTNVEDIPSYVEALAFFDSESQKLAVISTSDYINHNYHNYTLISKTSELLKHFPIKVCNLNAFISKNPTSNIESYLLSDHSFQADCSYELYTAAYITLYKYYKSFETLVENNFTTFIDGFIEACIYSNNDHPGTICYFNYEIHKIFKLRKTVFEMFKDYLNDYNNYLYIYKNQNEYKYTDKEFRALCKTLKIFSEAKTEAKENLIKTIEFLDNKEAV